MDNKKTIWEKPWQYIESICILGSLIVIGFSLQLIQPHTQDLYFFFPYNVLFLIVFILIITLLYFFKRELALIQWYLSIPNALVSIIALLLLISIMGIVPQKESNNIIINYLGLNHINHHYAFYLLFLQILASLGFITIKRLHGFQFKKDIGFIFNHLGLFIALSAGFLGAGDVQKLNIILYENQANPIAIHKTKEKVTLPFALLLKEFKLEEYPPKLVLINKKTGKPVQQNIFNANLSEIKLHTNYDFGNYQVQVIKYLATATRVSNQNYQAVHQEGAAPAALLKIYDKNKRQTNTYWISCGSYMQDYEAATVNEQLAFVMTVPEPKKYQSIIEILTVDGKRIPATIEMNKTFSYLGYKIYQFRYDEHLGRWSKSSVLELVRDPWLTYVYIGIGMMILGAFYMFWIGNTLNTQQK